MLVVLSATLMLVDLFVAIMQVTVSVAIMQLKVSVAFMESIHMNKLSNLVLKMVILMFSGSSHFCLPLHLSFQNVCKV